MKAKRLYEIAEKIRYEALGTKEYKGIKSNLVNYYKNQKSTENRQDKIFLEFENYLRNEIFVNKKEFKDISSGFKKNFDKVFKFKISSIKDKI